MIAYKNRFHGFNALKGVYAGGKTVRVQSMALRFMANPKRHEYRAAVVVSKKVHKSAVVRNRIRRRVYEVVRRQHLTTPFDLVFTAYSEDVATMDARALEQQITKLLTAAKITAAN